MSDIWFIEHPESAGKPWRPSNGTDGDIFMAQFCNRCKHDDPDRDVFCDILARAWGLDIKDPLYPKEWVRDGEGSPCCTAFEAKGLV